MKFTARILLLSIFLNFFFHSSHNIYANSWNLDQSHNSSIKDESWSYTKLEIEIQSWLEQSPLGDYLCKKETCKVNLSVEDYFTTKNIKDYSCHWDFGSGTFTTKDTDKKCNPGFVQYAPWKHLINIEIIRKEDNTTVQKSSLWFENTFYRNQVWDISNGTWTDINQEETTNTWATQDSDLQTFGETGDIHNWEKELTSTWWDIEKNLSGGLQKVFKAPKIVFDIQSWLEHSGSWELYICKKEDCKVNLSVEDIFTGAFIENDYSCQWDFGSGTFTTTDTDKKCNPWFVSYGTGSHIISLTITHIEDSTTSSTGALYFENWVLEKLDETQELKQETIESTKTEESTETNTASYSWTILSAPKIVYEIQSWLEHSGSWEIYTCKKEDCKVNLSVEDIFTGAFIKNDYSCQWDFGSGTFTTTDTDKKCNPWFVSYGTGSHTISLAVSHIKDSAIFSTGSLFFENIVISDGATDISEQNTDQQNQNTEEQNVESTEQSLSAEVFDTEVSSETPDTGSWINEYIPKSEFTENSSNNWEDSPKIDDSTDKKTEDISSSWWVILVPKIVFEIQSGLEYSETWDMYTCKKEDCKVNLSVEDIFTGAFIENDYSCQWDFGSGTFTTADTDKKCNPWFVSYGTGSHTISLTVSSLLDTWVFSTGSIYIENSVVSIDTDMSTAEQKLEEDINEQNQTPISVSNTQSLTTEDPGQDYSNLEIHESLQQPSYALKDSVGYICDQTRETCKINFLFHVTSGWEELSDYSCKIYNSVDKNSIETCNPKTLIFPEGENYLKIMIHEKQTFKKIHEKIVRIQNNWYIPKKSWNSWGSKSNTSKNTAKKTKLKIQTPNIEVQSWLDESFLCKKKNCKVNLIYKESKWEKCEWRFRWGDFKQSTASKCNPWYVSYPEIWKYTIVLKVSDKNYPNNYKTATLDIMNWEITVPNPQDHSLSKIDEKIWATDIQKVMQKSTKDFDTEFIIELQWKEVDYRVLSWSLIHCNKSPCYINLDASKSYRSDATQIELIWAYSWAQTQTNNPKGQWYETWKHSITLQDWENTHEFTIHVLEETQTSKTPKNTKEEILEPKDSAVLQWFLKIHAILPNPSWVDSDEYIELINTSSWSLNLKWLKIEIVTKKSTKKHTINNDLFLTGWKIVRFYKSQTKLNLPNAHTTISLSFSDQIIDTLDYNHTVADNYILSHNNSNITDIPVYVLEVIDGDTLKVQMPSGVIEKIRLVWVDTPEIYNTNNHLEIAYGKKARDYLASNIRNTYVDFEEEHINKRDKYGRLMWYIKYDWVNMNQSLISEWFSRAYLSYDFKYLQSFKKAESNAKWEKKWIWASKNYKKIVLQEKRDDLLVREALQTKNARTLKDNFYTDKNWDAIPDIFQNVFLKDTVTEDFSTGVWVRIDTAELYELHIQKTFSQRISKLQSALKISGKTLPSWKISIEILGKEYRVQANSFGEYELWVSDIFEAWEYQITNTLTDYYGNIRPIEKSYSFSIDTEYIKKRRDFENKKALKLAKKQASALKKAQARTKKSSSGKKIYSSIFVKQAQANNNQKSEKDQNSKIWILLILIFSLSLLFVTLNKKKLV